MSEGRGVSFGRCGGKRREGGGASGWRAVGGLKRKSLFLRFRNRGRRQTIEGVLG